MASGFVAERPCPAWNEEDRPSGAHPDKLGLMQHGYYIFCNSPTNFFLNVFFSLSPHFPDKTLIQPHISHMAFSIGKGTKQYEAAGP